ncbi:MAG: tetratricopeptide repeat protein [Chloroflexi bacterium]|nr:MAG: tetratricopeptide repeat protein [Chloroflexota bacterium]
MESSGAVTVGVAIITRDDLGPLKDLLAQVSGFDQVVVVDTGSRDGTRRYVKQLGPPYELHEFKWRPRPGDHQPDEWGFAAARAESFAHLKTTHAVWLDSDDSVVSVVSGRRSTLSAADTAASFRRLASGSSDTDVWLIDYVYAADEFGNPISVVGTERMVRLETGWRWRHPIHEVLTPVAKDVKDLRALAVNDLMVVHRPGDIDRSARRNRPMLKAWLRQLLKDGAPDTDIARARFLVGRSLRGEGQFTEAAQWMLSQYLAKHPEVNSEDKWEGWMDVAKNLFDAEDNEGARHAALQAIGLCPRFADGYVLLGEVKMKLGERPGDILKLVEIAESCGGESHGTHESNPLMTSFGVAMLAANSQFRLGRYRDALAMADRAIALRPNDKKARRVWEQSAERSSKQIAPATEVAASGNGAGASTAERSPSPVFVVSSGRCGSTLVSNMLRLHPDILSLSEFLIMLMPGGFAGGPAPIYGPQFWAILSTPKKRMTLMYRNDIVFDEVIYRPGPGRRFTAETGVPPILLTALPHLTDDPEGLYDEIHDFVMKQGAHTVSRHYILLFEWLRNRFQRKVWVERSGSSLVHLDDVMANFPNARFVHMYRDGRECAISMAHHSAFRLAIITGELMAHVGVDPFNSDDAPRGEVPPDLQKFMPETFDRDAFWNYDLPFEKLGRSWNAQEQRGIELLAQLPPERTFQLRYENLVNDPKGGLINLMRFIGLEDPDDEYLARAASLIRVKPPAWPKLPDGPRERLDEACRVSMGLLYGAEVLSPA